jgi:transcriptional regulator with XRE-family HTH domain
LANIRTDRKLSLRQVEDLTRRAVSNAYLSQVETGQIRQPSPNILHALAEAYRVSYADLMQMAGYITASPESDVVNKRAATFAALDLSEAEERMLLDYLKFRRKQEASSGED